MSEETTESAGFCEAMSPDNGVRCQLSWGHQPPTDTDNERFDHAAPSLGVWWHNPPAPTFGEPDKPVTRCEATYGTTEYRCTGAAGHADDHTAYSATVGDLGWSDADNAAKLPQRDDTTSPDCPERSPIGDVCTLTRGHEGMHERHFCGELMASWETPACGSSSRAARGATRRCIERAGHDGLHGDGSGIEWSGDRLNSDPVDDAPSWIGKVFGGLGGPTLKLTALNPQPVRVRFVDLPHRHVPRVVDGIPVSTTEPGGFALVVDRVPLGDLESEMAVWKDVGANLGARWTCIRVGELDIVGWLDGS